MPEEKIVSSNRVYVSPRFLLVLVLILVAVGSVLGVYLLAKQGNLSIGTFKSMESGINSGGVLPKSSFDNCSIKEGHPLLSDFKKTETVVSGIISGKIESIMLKSDETALVQVVSQDDSASQSFQIVTPQTQVQTSKKTNLLKDLRNGEVLRIFFTCDPKLRGDFRISKLLVVTPGLLK